MANSSQLYYSNLHLVFDIVGENFFGHVVVDPSSVVKEVGGAHYRGHESWVLNIWQIFHQLSLTLSRELVLYSQ